MLHIKGASALHFIGKRCIRNLHISIVHALSQCILVNAHMGGDDRVDADTIGHRVFNPTSWVPA